MDEEYEDDRYEVLRAERPELRPEMTVGRIEQLDKPGGFDEPLTEQYIRELIANAPTPPPEPFSDDEIAGMEEARAQAAADKGPRPSPHAPSAETENWDILGPQIKEAIDRLQEEKERRETLGQGADGGGQRLNAGKNRIELLPPEWIWALADVMTQGSKKYPARNWELGMDWSSMIGCVHRHIAKFQAGQRYDGPKFDQVAGTTGCHELAMVAWNALALMVYDLRGIGNNDMPHEDYAQLDLFKRVNAETSDLSERLSQYTTMEPGS